MGVRPVQLRAGPRPPRVRRLDALVSVPCRLPNESGALDQSVPPGSSAAAAARRAAWRSERWRVAASAWPRGRPRASRQSSPVSGVPWIRRVPRCTLRWHFEHSRTIPEGTLRPPWKYRARWWACSQAMCGQSGHMQAKPSRRCTARRGSAEPRRVQAPRWMAPPGRARHRIRRPPAPAIHHASQESPAKHEGERASSPPHSPTHGTLSSSTFCTLPRSSRLASKPSDWPTTRKTIRSGWRTRRATLCTSAWVTARSLSIRVWKWS